MDIKIQAPTNPTWKEALNNPSMLTSIQKLYKMTNVEQMATRLSFLIISEQDGWICSLERSLRLIDLILSKLARRPNFVTVAYTRFSTLKTK
jgi:hypothetical protein